MTDQKAYQEHIQRRYNAFCKAVIRYAALAAALSVLPEQMQEEILRYYFLRQPQRVIGAHIGRSRSTAGRHIQLALQRLREEMEVRRP